MAVQPLAGGDPDQIAGYRVRARLGAGGMGVVYLAYTALGRPVAVRAVRPELGSDPAFRERFRQEVAAARRVSGLFTAQVLDADRGWRRLSRRALAAGAAAAVVLIAGAACGALA